MRIHDGTPALKNFIEHYKQSTDFKFKNRPHPVIVLLDNDCAAQKVVDLISGKKYKKENVVYDRYSNFSYHVTSNLYVVLLPISPTQNPCNNTCNKSKKSNKLKDNTCNKIEDLFDSSFTDTILGGKTFSYKNNKEFDEQKHYSKNVFATKVIRPRQEKIDFSNFEEILKLISKVISDYNNPKPQ